VTLTITAQQRDALYEQILDRLSGIGDVWLAVRAEDFESAERLGREYSDDLRLVLDDLGFGEGTGAAVELTTPADVLRRALVRLRDTAAARDAAEQEERAEIRESEKRNRLVMAACRRLLADIDGGQADGG
jgi:hypothetical protein